MPRAASARGSTWTRTAYFCEPITCTWATPSTVEIRCASMVSAHSFTSESGSVAEDNERSMTGSSAGFAFRKDGGFGMSWGRRRWTAEIEDCTSWAAPSMLRSRLNWRVIWVSPSELVDVIESMPAIVANCCSSGVATEAAMVSGLAPGRLAETVIVGKSMLGRSLTGRRWYAIVPKIVMAAVTRVVITGRRMNCSGMFMAEMG